MALITANPSQILTKTETFLVPISCHLISTSKDGLDYRAVPYVIYLLFFFLPIILEKVPQSSDRLRNLTKERVTLTILHTFTAFTNGVFSRADFHRVNTVGTKYTT